MTVKRKLVVAKLPQGQMYKIQWEGGGELPASLTGRFNRIRHAEKAITDFEVLKAKPKREYRKSRVREDAKDSTKRRSK